MSGEEVFVGLVAIAVGAFAVLAAVLNKDWHYGLGKIRWIEGRFGRAGARAFYALLGAALIVLGVAIALGFSPNKSTGRRDGETELLPVQPDWLHRLLDDGRVAVR